MRLVLERDELHHLTDRELRDVGLSRYDVAKRRRFSESSYDKWRS